MWDAQHGNRTSLWPHLAWRKASKNYMKERVLFVVPVVCRAKVDIRSKALNDPALTKVRALGNEAAQTEKLANPVPNRPACTGLSRFFTDRLHTIRETVARDVRNRSIVAAGAAERLPCLSTGITSGMEIVYRSGPLPVSLANQHPHAPGSFHAQSSSAYRRCGRVF